MASFTVEEREALKNFRTQIGDLLDKLDNYQQQDLCLLRWLRARELNVDKAEEMLRKAMKWRQDNKVDSILKVWEAPIIVRDALPVRCSGTDKDGCVICLQPYGKWELRQIVEKGYASDFVKFWIQFLEQGTALMRQDSIGKKEPITQFVLIYDMEGFSMKQMFCREKIAAELNVMKIFEANYPETLKAAYVVNAPKIFEVLFAFFKPILTGHTLSKVKVFGSNTAEWRAALLENIEPDELPSEYGGSNTSCPNYTVDQGIEWLKKGIALPDKTFSSLMIPPGQSANVDINVSKSGARLYWNFKCEDYDIGFSFLHGNDELFCCRRADAHLHVQKGTHVVAEAGTYTLRFDNSYSKFRAKKVQYTYSTSEDNNN
ncbi:unnamed protein product [Allacma fusca]|uniref:SEC14-like protein 2 n=1 Tax=Allacma fusca TaxID=39272 RepID=A0A8J2KCR6_9HEXA|nr:unnamed protein product [Allacma fusca]